MDGHWREDDDNRVTRALAEMGERCEELEHRVSMLEDETELLEMDDDDEEDGFLAGVGEQDEDEEEVEFLGDIDEDEDEVLSDMEIELGLQQAKSRQFSSSPPDLVGDAPLADTCKELGGDK